ncbi:MAG: hypothetical protein HGA86_07120 [Anaerolineaceae bacterium]|nr:hypothetical protein [Anaerolineaceae bacterium]
MAGFVIYPRIVAVVTEISNYQETPAVTVAPTIAVEPGDLANAVNNEAVLKEVVVPNSDSILLAEKYKNIQDIPELLIDKDAPYAQGAVKKFWVSNQDTNENFQIDAVMEYVTPHVYFWIEKGVEFDRQDLKKLVDTFEEKIYPTNREFFGSEWSPGIDGDVHLHIIYARNLGSNIAGVFFSNDSLPPAAHPYSNAHETFVLSADNITLDENFTYGVLAHEFQHMIHWNQDRNEDSWVNEGFSELASFLNGYDVGGHDYAFTTTPDSQLNDWTNEPNLRTYHSGGSFLFFTYFLDRFGEDATKALAAEKQNGLVSIDKVLRERALTDPSTGAGLTATDVFRDWTITNFLKDGSVGDGRYTYRNYPEAPMVSATENFSNCPLDWQQRTVSQFGADYYQFACSGNYTFEFEGSKVASLWPAEAHSGSYVFWSNMGDDSNMNLTQTFDLSGVQGKVEMRYWTWYDLEKDYDYSYLLASEDGQKWDMLKTPACSTDNVSGNNFGCGYNGASDGWVEQVIDLSAYAGKKVTLQFEYVTDAAVNGEGMLLDDISIPAINYSTDFENGLDGWQGSGFVRVERLLPQKFLITRIERGNVTSVTPVELDAENHTSVDVNISGDNSDVVFVISGATRFTRQAATYQFRIK